MRIAGEIQLDDLPLLPVPAAPADLAGVIPQIAALALDVDSYMPQHVAGYGPPRDAGYGGTGAGPVPPEGVAALLVLMAGWSPLDDRAYHVEGWSRRPGHIYAAHDVIRDTLGRTLHTPHDGPGMVQAYRLWCDPRHVARIPHAENWDHTLRTGRPQPVPEQAGDDMPAPVDAPDDTPRQVDPLSDLLWSNHQVGRWQDDTPTARTQRRRWAQHRDTLAAAAVPYLAAWASWANTLLSVVNTQPRAIAAPPPTQPRRRRVSWGSTPR